MSGSSIRNNIAAPESEPGGTGFAGDGAARTIWMFTDDEWHPVMERLHNHLRILGAEVEVFAPARSPSISIEIAGQELAVFDGQQRLRLPDCAIRLRSPIPSIADSSPLDDDGRRFVRSQWHIMWMGLYLGLERAGVHLINRTNTFLADEKTHQLLAAAHAGLATLPTVHTASGARVRQHHGDDARVAMKPFDPVVRRVPTEGRQTMSRTVAMPTARLAAGLDASRVKSPSIVQPFVEAAFEHRVVVVGGKVWGARVPRVGAAAVDIRSVPVSELGATPSELPDDVVAGCVRLTQSVGAEIAAIDLLETDDGFVFLDLNCGGHFLFVEQLTDAPICQAIAELALDRQFCGPAPAGQHLMSKGGET